MYTVAIKVGLAPEPRIIKRYTYCPCPLDYNLDSLKPPKNQKNGHIVAHMGLGGSFQNPTPHNFFPIDSQVNPS